MSDAYLENIPDRPESILKLVAHAWNTSSSITSTAVTSLEAPSANYSAQLMFPDLKIEVGEIPEPDPRLPFANVDIKAWEYDGTEACPALPVPPSDLLSAFSENLTLPFSLNEWGTVAAGLAKDFRKLAPCEILGTLIQPPDFPQTEWPWNWLFRSQLMGLLILARSQTKSWINSNQGQHVKDIVYGPVDWTTTAALVALTDRARQDISCRDEIFDLFLSLLKKPMSPIWFMCAYKPIWQLLQHFPGLDSDINEIVQKRVEEFENEEDEI